LQLAMDALTLITVSGYNDTKPRKGMWEQMKSKKLKGKSLSTFAFELLTQWKLAK
jgi:hypothetical protein